MADQLFCEVCGCEIDTERRDALPKTRLCTKHGEEIKKYGGEFVGTGSHDNVGKGGIKSLTAGVTVTFERNQQGIERLKDDHDREVWEARKRTQQQSEQKPQDDN